MDRRSFLARLGFGTVAAAAAATGVLDIERLLWVPGERTIFIPSGVVGNTFVTPDWVARELLESLKNNLRLAGIFNRAYDDRFVIGDTVRVGLPRRFQS